MNLQNLDLGIFYNQQGILTDLSVLIWDKTISDKNRKLYNSFIIKYYHKCFTDYLCVYDLGNQYRDELLHKIIFFGALEKLCNEKKQKIFKQLQKEAVKKGELLTKYIIDNYFQDNNDEFKQLISNLINSGLPIFYLNIMLTN